MVMELSTESVALVSVRTGRFIPSLESGFSKSIPPTKDWEKPL